MSANYDEEYNFNSNGNGDYNSHRQTENNEQGTKRTFDERDGSIPPSKKLRRQDSRVGMRCLVPSKTAGGIIGKGGCNIKDMRESFSAQIQIPFSDAPERVLQVRASPESCGEILLRIIPTINDSGSGRFRPGETSNMSVKLLVHQSQAGGVIGVKGYKIKELREKTGASIKVHQECAPNSTDRICVISGTPDIISRCVVLIMDLLMSTPPKGPIQNYDPAFDGPGPMGDFGFRNDFDMDQFGPPRRYGGSGPRGMMGGGFGMGRAGFRGRMMNRGSMGPGYGRSNRDFGMDRGMRRGGMYRGRNNGSNYRERDLSFRGRGNMRGRYGEGGYENY